MASHASAAVLHRLPVPDSALGKVHLTRPRSVGGGKKRSLISLHSSRLEGPDVTEIGGIPVTSLARTVFDLARTLPFDQGVAAGDRALAVGMAVELLSEMLERGKHWAASEPPSGSPASSTVGPRAWASHIAGCAASS